MILEELGDEVRAARILCIYRRHGREYLITLPGGKGRRSVIRGEPARAIVEKLLRYRPPESVPPRETAQPDASDAKGITIDAQTHATTSQRLYSLADK